MAADQTWNNETTTMLTNTFTISDTVLVAVAKEVSNLGAGSNVPTRPTSGQLYPRGNH